MLNEVIKVLNEAHNISIYTHINTDCDALGSALALKEAMNGLGKNVDIYIHSNFPVSFQFYGDLSFINQKTIEGKYDLAVCVDCASEARLGKYKFVYRKVIRKTLNIDHHSANELFCKVNYIKKFCLKFWTQWKSDLLKQCAKICFQASWPTQESFHTVQLLKQWL